MIARAAVVVAASVLPALAASAHVVSDRELVVVSRMPDGFVTRAFAAHAPDSAGFVRPNRADAWRAVGFQRGALMLLVDAAARGDSLAAERGWWALERAFDHQLPDGGFGHGPSSATTAGAAGGASLAGDAEVAWLGAACRAVIAVMNSPLQQRFRWRYALLKPKLQRAADAFERRHQEFLRRHARRPALLLTAAAALLLADGVYHDERYGEAGQRALVAALALQRPDGGLGVEGSLLPAEHALGLGALQSITIYFPSPTLERAATRAARWLGRKGRRTATTRILSGAAEVLLISGETPFVLRYAAIRPPPPVAAPTHGSLFSPGSARR